MSRSSLGPPSASLPGRVQQPSTQPPPRPGRSPLSGRDLASCDADGLAGRVRRFHHQGFGGERARARKTGRVGGRSFRQGGEGGRRREHRHWDWTSGWGRNEARHKTPCASRPSYCKVDSVGLIPPPIISTETCPETPTHTPTHTHTVRSS